MKLPRLSTPPRLRLLALDAKIKHLSLDSKPILVGPFRSEVGFEASYWIPFVNAIAKRVPNFWERAVIVTRGGAHVWYHPSVKAVDIYSLRSVDEFRKENIKDQHFTGLQKQMQVTAWDRRLLHDVAQRALGSLPHARRFWDAFDYHALHPSWMYWSLAPWWDEHVGMQHLNNRLVFPPIPAPPLPDGLQLPQTFVAVKLYERMTFPDNPMTRDFCKNLLTRLSAQRPVVLLHQPKLHADDHHDLPLSGPNIFQIPEFPVERNLEYLSAILGRAEAFIGTYGGVQQLALRMGVRSVGFYTSWHSTARAHLTLSQAMGVATGVDFVAMSVREAGLCKLALRETKVIEKAVA